ncbi:MAG: hypothetical protein Q7S09_05195 [bacterium]|nr:hypothetical protein [bacterium]
MMIAQVNYAVCDTVVVLITSLGGFPGAKEDPVKMSVPASILGTLNLVAVAINHQTTPLVGRALVGTIDGAICKGWDYLWRRLVRLAEEDSTLFLPPNFANMTPEKLAGLLADGNSGGVITDVSRRAAFIVDIGQVMLERGWESAEDLCREVDGWLIRNDDKNGLYGLLKKFVAYASDPLEKKSNYFLALQQASCNWEYCDPEHLEAPVNYHEQRLHLRKGTVEILDEALAGRIRRREPVTKEEDLAIRGAVKEAIRYIAEGLGVSPADTHYAFWNYSRNCCSRDKTHCESCGPTCGLPERYKVQGVTQCIFAPICMSRGKPVSEMLLEPSLDDTDWY